MIKPVVAYPPPPPMDDVRRAQFRLVDVQAAITRAQRAWNMAQFDDALDSAQRFLDMARATAKEKRP